MADDLPVLHVFNIVKAPGERAACLLIEMLVIELPKEPTSRLFNMQDVHRAKTPPQDPS